MSGKSKEEIAFELVSKLKGVGVWGENNMTAILDMYALCLEATSGLRSVDGKASAANQLANQTTAPASAPAPAVRAAAPARPAAPQHQPAAAAPQQPAPQQPQVHQQQQMVQQAYQQQPPVQR